MAATARKEPILFYVGSSVVSRVMRLRETDQNSKINEFVTSSGGALSVIY